MAGNRDLRDFAIVGVKEMAEDKFTKGKNIEERRKTKKT